MNTIFKGIVGSQAYGTNTPTSDIDIKGVYIQPLKEILGFSYRPQIEVGKDECYYEVKRFLELLSSANPTVLELLFLPERCVKIHTGTFQLIKQQRDLFVTKKCLNSFGGYAVKQIKKAGGLDKKMNWEKERVERKGILDFCYIEQKGKSVTLTKYLKDENLDPQYCGMVKLDHMVDCYVIYHDNVSQWAQEANHRFKSENGEVPSLGFKGISSDDGNHLLLSSVPKYTLPREGVVYFNKSEYAKHCKDFNSYNEWLENRNTARYVDSIQHGQRIDGKNLMHCRRLIDMAMEIAQYGKVLVDRTNKDYLLSIRRGEVKLDDIIDKAEEDILLLDELYAKSNLPAQCDARKVEDLLITIRTT